MFIWFTVLRLFLYRNVRVLLFTTPWNSLNLSRLFHCSVIKVLCFVVVLGDSLFIISYQVCFVKNFFHFFESFSLNRFCPICYLKRDNFDILSCVVLFVNNFFYFPKDKQSSIFFPPQQKCLSFAVDFYTTIIVRICQHFFSVYKKFIMSVRITLFSYRYFNNLLWYMQATRALPISLVLVTAIM